MKSRVKPGGPPPKPKYSWMTDSELVGRLNDEKNSYKLSSKNLKPNTYNAVGVLWPARAMADCVPFA